MKNDDRGLTYEDLICQAICKLSLVITWARLDEKNSNNRNILKVNFPLKTTNQKLVVNNCFYS